MSMFSDVHIETRRLILRPFSKQDIDAFQRIAGQEEILRFLPESDRMTPNEMEETLDWLISCYRKNTHESIIKFTLPIILKNSGELIGWCGIGPVEFDESEIEIYFLISFEYWGNGFATEATEALLTYSFDHLGLTRIVALVDPANLASIGVLKKLGMRQECTICGLNQCYSHYEGHMLYALEADENRHAK